jgi:hypothetical protein
MDSILHSMYKKNSLDRGRNRIHIVCPTNFLTTNENRFIIVNDIENFVHFYDHV